MERRPDPPPLEIDLVVVVSIGTALWAAALVVLLVLGAAGVEIHDWWWQMCASGAGLGLAGVEYCRRRRAALQRTA